LLELLLLPLTLVSFLFQGIVLLRRACYSHGLCKSHQLPCKVISIGNITVGGTGKTPMVHHIASCLKTAGLNTAVLMRGYHGKETKTSVIVSDGQHLLAQPEQAGDEAFMLAQKLSGVPVLAGKDRISLGEQARQNFTTDIVLLDDGFQYYPLLRDLDIVLINAVNPFGNGFLLPRGILREPLSALSRSSIILLTKTEQSRDTMLLEQTIKRYSPGAHMFKSSMVAQSLRKVLTNEPVAFATLQGKHVIGLCSIGDPGSFCAMLQSLNPATLQRLIFPDHHWYDETDYKNIHACGAAADFIITTEKDIAKMDLTMLDNHNLCVLEIGLVIEREKELFQRIYEVCGITFH
jgi:tetraacyldisaccharide 4'-kinase